MATGIPPREMQKRKKISVSLSYEGKESFESILNYPGKQFEVQFPINGDGQNVLFFGDNIDALAYLLKNGYNNIAIYGMSYVGETLLNELTGSEIDVKYAIDKKANEMYSDIELFSPDDKLKEVDAVIVTAITFYEEIEEMLAEKMDCPILSLENILDVI